MKHYIHHVPGRVRMKNPDFKGNTNLLQEVASCFQGQEGIEGIETTPLTGSVVILYDQQIMPVQHMANLLQECKYIDHKQVIGLDQSMQKSFSQAGRYMGKIGLSLVADWALSGTRLSLVTALL